VTGVTEPRHAHTTIRRKRRCASAECFRGLRRQKPEEILAADDADDTDIGRLLPVFYCLFVSAAYFFRCSCRSLTQAVLTRIALPASEGSSVVHHGGSDSRSFLSWHSCFLLEKVSVFV